MPKKTVTRTDSVRKRIIKVVVNDEELAQITRRAEQAHMSTSGFSRLMALCAEMPASARK